MLALARRPGDIISVFHKRNYLLFICLNVVWSQDAGEGRRRPSLEDEEFKSYEEQYPSARGLVGK